MALVVLFLCLLGLNILTITASVQLTDLSHPEIIDAFKEKILHPGEMVTLTCKFKGNPKPEIEWKLDEMEITTKNNFEERTSIDISNNIVSELFISNIRTEDGGIFKCIAKNKEGEAVYKARIHVFGNVSVRSNVRVFVTAEETAEIDCPYYGHPVKSVIWQKNNITLPENKRQMPFENGTLFIKNVQRRKDSGKYRCIVEGNDGSLTAGDTEIIIMVRPKITPFSFQEEQIQEGIRARIHCVVNEGESPLEIKWLKDGHSIPSDLGITIRHLDEFSGVLLINAIASRHNGNYTCIASNMAGQAFHTAPLFVNVIPRIIPFKFRPNVLEGNPIRVTCVVDQGDLPISLKWMKDGMFLYDFQGVTIRKIDDYSSLLIIDNVNTVNSGNYTCVASNAAGTVMHTTSLIVHVPPEWVTAPSDVEVRIGQWLILHCQATGYPLPQISWERSHRMKLWDQKFIPLESNDNMKIFPNGSLRFQHIEKSDEGYYYCIASNNIGEPLSRVITIKVNAAPVFKLKHKQILAKKGETVSIPCKADGDEQMTYTWTVNNISLEDWFNSHRYKLINDVNEKAKESSSELTIYWVDKKDTVLFICRAENSIGTDEIHISLLIQYPPESPTITTPINIFNQSVQLEWIAPFDGNSRILRYFIEFKMENKEWHEQSIPAQVQLKKYSEIISNLNPATIYTFRIKAENEIGNGTYSKEVKAKTEAIAPSGSPQNVQVESTEPTVLRITWNPPEKTSKKGAIQGYNIGYKINGSSVDYKYSQLEVPEDYREALIYQLTNLQMYTQYEVIVQAYNIKGSGPSSEPVVAMTSEGVPSEPPRSVRCSTLSSKNIYLLWDPPRSESLNGILRGYKVLYKPANEWYDAMQQFKITHTPKISLQELEINTNYSFQVLAFTKVGDGKRSEAIQCKTFEDVPEAPVAIKVLPSSSDSVVVSWKPSKKINTAINQYNVYYKPLEEGQEIDDGAQNTEQFRKDAILQQSHSEVPFLQVNGLKKNKKYAFWVTASSSLGESPTSSLIAQTVADSVVPAKTASFDDTKRTPWKKDVILPCKAVGFPTPNIKWTVESRPLSENGHLIFHPDGALMITKATSEDSGNYTCAVYNEYGKDAVTYNVIVQVPPSAPKLDFISKSKFSIQLQWKAGLHGGDPIRGYLLHHKKGSDSWTTVEITPEHRIYTLENLHCGTSYQLYMEAFNSIGTSAPSETITVETGGAEEIPSSNILIKEGSTFATVHLDSWPSTGCPVEFFGIEYKATLSKEWTAVGSNISPSQTKVVISDLTPATRYLLRLLVQTSGDASMHEYKFSTLTITGDVIPPDVFEDIQPVYIFHLDPWIFIPAVILLIVVIIASVVVFVVVKQRNGSMGIPSEMDLSLATNQMNTWIRSSRALSTDYGYSQHHSKLSTHYPKDPSPYATAHMIDCFPSDLPEPAQTNQFNQPGSSQTWKPKKSDPDFQKGFLHHSQPDCSGKSQLQETMFVFPQGIEQRFTVVDNISIGERFDSDYDPPPKAHMLRNSFPNSLNDNLGDCSNVQAEGN